LEKKALGEKSPSMNFTNFHPQNDFSKEKSQPPDMFSTRQIEEVVTVVVATDRIAAAAQIVCRIFPMALMCTLN